MSRSKTKCSEKETKDELNTRDKRDCDKTNKALITEFKPVHNKYNFGNFY